MMEIRVPRWRLCVRLFNRPNWLWPYFSRRYMPACFGVGYWGVMVMRTMTAAEITAFNRRALGSTPGQPQEER
jgi:hypothetical protein